MLSQSSILSEISGDNPNHQTLTEPHNFKHFFTEKLWIKETLYHTLASNFPHTVVMLFNPQFEHYCIEGEIMPYIQLTKNYLEGKTIQEIYPPTQVEQIQELYNDALQNIPRKLQLNWQETILSIHTLPVKNAQEEIFAGMVILQDITESQRSTAELDKTLALLRSTLESTADGIIVISLQGDIVGFNQKFLQMWHINDPDAIITLTNHQSPFNFILDQIKDGEIFTEKTEQIITDHHPDKNYHLLELTDGRIFESYSLPHRLGDQIVGIVWSFRDITKQKTTEKALIKSIEREKFLSKITKKIRQSLNIDEIVNTAMNELGKFLTVDRLVLFRLSTVKKNQLIIQSLLNQGKNVKELPWYKLYFQPQQITNYYEQKNYIVNDVNREYLELEEKQIFLNGEIQSNLSIPILISEKNINYINNFNQEHSQVTKLWGLLSLQQNKPYNWEKFEIEFLQEFVTQLSLAIEQSLLFQELQTANLELQRLAALDGLTQLANRRRFDQYLNQEWRRSTRDLSPISLILCDIDHFKIYNDTYGHQIGDDCLKQVAGTLRLAVNRPADLAARYGGEEFALILPNTNTEGALYIAETIRTMIKELEIVHVLSPVNPYVTLSMGIATIIPHRNTNYNALISAADKALYDAKRSGRDRVCISQI
jgi:diguanylate cyclase (GGDEF)-like protein